MLNDNHRGRLCPFSGLSLKVLKFHNKMHTKFQKEKHVIVH